MRIIPHQIKVTARPGTALGQYGKRYAPLGENLDGKSCNAELRLGRLVYVALKRHEDLGNGVGRFIFFNKIIKIGLEPGDDLFFRGRAGTVFVCVVDPGVGGKRPGVVVLADGRWYTGPNEGLFAPLARRAKNIQCWLLPDPVPGASPSFHGRDVFAPLAGRLARDGRYSGAELAATGLDMPDWPDDLWRVVYIDRFGNAITGLRSSVVGPDAMFKVNGHSLHHARTFSDVGEGAGFWYGNSSGLVEFAVNRGRADTLLGLRVGTEFSS